MRCHDHLKSFGGRASDSPSSCGEKFRPCSQGMATQKSPKYSIRRVRRPFGGHLVREIGLVSGWRALLERPLLSRVVSLAPKKYFRQESVVQVLLSTNSDFLLDINYRSFAGHGEPDPEHHGSGMALSRHVAARYIRIEFYRPGGWRNAQHWKNFSTVKRISRVSTGLNRSFSLRCLHRRIALIRSVNSWVFCSFIGRSPLRELTILRIHRSIRDIPPYRLFWDSAHISNFLTFERVFAVAALSLLERLSYQSRENNLWCFQWSCEKIHRFWRCDSEGARTGTQNITSDNIENHYLETKRVNIQKNFMICLQRLD